MKYKFLFAILMAAFSFMSKADQYASTYKSATRYNLSGQVTGTISSDPDGSGGLNYIATRYYYNNQGLVYLIQKGYLLTWQNESVKPDAWQDFKVESETRYEYDGLGRKIIEKITSSDGSKSFQLRQYSYDEYNRLECTAIRMNPAAYINLPSSACNLSAPSEYGQDRITKTIYDSRDRVTKIIKAYDTPLEQVYAAYTYNHFWQQDTITDANGNLAKKEYDGFGRVYRWYFPDSQKGYGLENNGDYEQYTYDQNGNITHYRKRDDKVIAYEYDNLNRVIKKDLPNTTSGDVFYSYDLRNLETDAKFGSLSGNGVKKGYTPFGELEYETNSSSRTSFMVSYTYDKNRNRTSIKYQDGVVFNYTYDYLNRLKGIGDGSNVLLTSTIYNNNGQVESLNRANKSYTTFTYGEMGKPESTYHYLFGVRNDVKFGYEYTPAGQIAKIDNNNSVYDNTSPKKNEYYEINGLNQYTKVASKTFSYDLNGNLKFDGTSHFTYDVENRLTNVSGAKSATLKYDPLGRLYEYTANGVTRLFVYDGDALIAEYNTNGNMLNRYVHGVGADVPLVSYQGSSINGTSRSFLHANHQGSIIAVSGNSSNIEYKNKYDEYGVPNTANSGRFGYTGQLYLKEIGLFHYKARTYYPEIGRFLQIDPIGYKDQMNLYTYVGNDPINMIDPTGLSGCDDKGSQGLRGQCIDSSNFNEEEEDVADTIVSDSDTDALARDEMDVLEKEDGERGGYFGESEDGSKTLTEVEGESYKDGNVWRTIFPVPSDAKAAAHSHPEIDGEAVPGPDDNKVVNNGRPSYIYHDGRVIVVERSGGQWRVRVIRGELTDRERKKTRTLLNKFQGS